jgi:hypothetical protein
MFWVNMDMFYWLKFILSTMEDSGLDLEIHRHCDVKWADTTFDKTKD